MAEARSQPHRRSLQGATRLLTSLLEDVETVLEKHSRLTYFDSTFTKQATQQITVLSIDTDEGVLEPLGVGEMIIEVRY